MTRYTVSIHYDRRLYRQDIVGSIAHARMLSRQDIISSKDADAIVVGLETIRDEIEVGSFSWREDREDIHMNIEGRLFDLIGEVAGKLHTARSRNDQVALDMRLYVKEVTTDVIKSLHTLRKRLVEKADANSKVVMPGYTHLQRAQPVLFAHHMLAYFEMLGRDEDRFRQVYQRADIMPLGSGALAGVPYPIDREFVARDLGFSQVSKNSMDAVSDRDFLLDFHSAAAISMLHLSRLAEELVLWSSEEFSFIQISDDYTTGSSIMPQKRNPDFAELARGKSGRVFGHLVALLTVLKGLPLTYNRDMQEDKEGLFDTVDAFLPTLNIFSQMLSDVTINSDNMRDALESGGVLATDFADYLVAKGMPFREAHSVVSQISDQARVEKKRLQNLPLETFRCFSKLFDEDVLDITVESSVNARDVYGGTSFTQVNKAIAVAKTILESRSDQ